MKEVRSKEKRKEKKGRTEERQEGRSRVNGNKCPGF